MLQLLPRNSTLIPNTTNPKEAAAIIEEYIEKYHCENLSIDISFMNVLDACYVSTICSAKHYIKYPEGKIHWKISSELIRDFNKSLELGNCNYSS